MQLDCILLTRLSYTISVLNYTLAVLVLVRSLLAQNFDRNQS